MKILFKREQTAGRVGAVQFKLWAKLELDADEQALVKRYKFDQSILISGTEPKLIRNSAMLSIPVGLIAFLIIGLILPQRLAMVAGLLAFGGFAYWYYNQKREKLFVKDLLHGRTFVCPGIVELTQKEDWLSNISLTLRQVHETAKHWGGTQTEDIPVLSREDAREVVLRLG